MFEPALRETAVMPIEATDERRWTRNWSRGLAVCALLAILVTLVARTFGPVDFSNQDQPKTTSYTTNIAVHPERWALPRQVEWYTATKPPLYNWVALPFVELTQGRSVLAHRAPSLLSFAGLVALAWLIGSRLDVLAGRTRLAPEFAEGRNGRWRAFISGSVLPVTGSLAVLMFACNYTWYKQSMLARPDAILSFCLMLGWAAACVVIARAAMREVEEANADFDRSHRRPSIGGWQLLIWVSAGFAGLAKGPPALLIPIFAIALSWFVGGRVDAHAMHEVPQKIRFSWRSRDLVSRTMWAVRVTGMWWGFPLMLAIVGLWVFLAWYNDPDHTYRVLIKDEFLERITGTGTQGAKHGPIDFVRTLPYMPLYFVSRYLPWSLFYIAAVIDLVQRRRADRIRGVTPEAHAENRLAAGTSAHEGTNSPSITAARIERQTWIVACALYPIITIIFFSLSTGKRPDYVAAAYFPASILVAWWFSYLGLQIGRRFRAFAPTLAGLTVAGVALHEAFLGFGVKYPLGGRLVEFAHEVRIVIAEDGPNLPIEFYGARRSTLQTLLHRSQVDLIYVEDPMMGDDRTLDVRLAEIETSGSGEDIPPEAAVAGGTAAVMTALRRHDAFWLVARLDDFAHLEASEPELKTWSIETRALSTPAFGGPGAAHPLQFGLFHIDPTPDRP